MKLFLFFLPFYLSFLITCGQNLDWVNILKGNGPYDAAVSVNVGSDGNIYTCGYFYDTVDFDPGPGVNLLISNGDADLFFAKYDASGNLVWCKSIGSPPSLGNADIALSILSDNNAVYFSGWYSGTVDFDPSSNVYNMTTIQYQDGFISKFDLNGNFLWVRSVDPDFRRVKQDINGNLYLIGNFQDTVDFDPGLGVFNISSNTPAGFILKLDSNGNFLEVKNFQSNVAIGIADFTINQSGEIYISGFFYGTSDFDLGPSVYNLSSYDSLTSDVFLVKFDANGDFLWARTMTGENTGGIYNIHLDNNNSTDIYVVGEFSGTVNFEPSSGNNYLTSTGSVSYSNNVFLTKLDSAGDLNWIKTFDSRNRVGCSDVHVDNTDNVYVYGTFLDSLDINPGPDQNFLSKGQAGDAFVVRLDNIGNYISSFQILTTSNTPETFGITTDLNNNVYIVGGIYDTICFDQQYIDTLITTSYDAFIAKYNMNTVGLQNHEYINSIIAFPNPTSNKFTIELNQALGIANIEITNILGQSIATEQKQNANSITIEIPGPAGLYLVTITDGKGYKSVIKVVKE